MARLLRRIRQLLLLVPPLLHKTITITIVICLGGRLSITDMGTAEGISRITPIAHRDQVVLLDRSVLDLNADTSALIKQGPHERQVFLQNGEIRATVKHDDSNPMEVFVGHTVFEDLGTQFDISTHETTTNIAVTAGKVRIYQRLANGDRVDPVTVTRKGARRDPVYLVMGDLARLEERGGIVVVSKDRNSLERAQSRSSWLHDEFIAAGQPLDEVIWQFNRYHNAQIVINDLDTARLVIGGAYNLADVDGLLSALDHLFHLKATPIVGGQGTPPVYILQRTSTGTHNLQ